MRFPREWLPGLLQHASCEWCSCSLCLQVVLASTLTTTCTSQPTRMNTVLVELWPGHCPACMTPPPTGRCSDQQTSAQR